MVCLLLHALAHTHLQVASPLANTLCVYPHAHAQTGKWQFLLFKGTFNVRLDVVEDPGTRTIVFTLAESSFMRNFEGRWQVETGRQQGPR